MFGLWIMRLIYMFGSTWLNISDITELTEGLNVKPENYFMNNTMVSYIIFVEDFSNILKFTKLFLEWLKFQSH
jgi:hypothetical protein